MAREVIYTVCRSVYGPYESQKWYHKELFTVRKLHFISGTYNIFMAREVIYRLSIRTDRTDRKSDIRSVKNFLRSVNCISLVELRIFSWQERSYMVCRAVRTVRIGTKPNAICFRFLVVVSMEKKIQIRSLNFRKRNIYLNSHPLTPVISPEYANYRLKRLVIHYNIRAILCKSFCDVITRVR